LLDARYFELDVVRPATIDAAAAMVAAEFQRVDVLVNKTGINAPRRWSAGHGHRKTTISGRRKQPRQFLLVRPERPSDPLS
jgi:NAD(P)-dependent dehydrogenase (short-subunit alcohol dehydrogenase family)